MRLNLGTLGLFLALAQPAAADDGLYFGLGLGVLKSTSEAPVVTGYEAAATDISVALTLGYRWPQAGVMVFGV